jgi:hypothetical protein
MKYPDSTVKAGKTMAKKPTTKRLLTVDATVDSQSNRELLVKMFPQLGIMISEMEAAGAKVKLKIDKVQIEIEEKKA